MKIKRLAHLIAAVIFVLLFVGCGNSGSSPFVTPHPAQIWTGIWNSNKVVSSGTFSMLITQSNNIYSGTITMTGSPCFSSATVTAWNVTGNAVSWTSPEIGGFAGTLSGGAISGTYAVTSAGACFGDTGVFSITS